MQIKIKQKKNNFAIIFLYMYKKKIRFINISNEQIESVNNPTTEMTINSAASIINCNAIINYVKFYLYLWLKNGF